MSPSCTRSYNPYCTPPRAPRSDLGARGTRAFRTRGVLAVLAAPCVVIACGGRDAARQDAVPVGGVNATAAPVLAAGTYTVRSHARLPGATLRLVDNRAGAYSGQVVLAGAKGLYQGIVRAPTPTTVEMSLSCLCPAGPDGFGGTRYAQQSVSGTYAITALGGDRFELRQTSGTPNGPGGQMVVDTVERTP